MGTFLNLLQAAVLLHAHRTDVSPPLRTIRPHPPDVRLHERFEQPSSRALAMSHDFVDPVAQTFLPAAPSIHFDQNFEGLGVGFVGPAGEYGGPNYTPPDTNGDVGPNHYVQTVNVSFVVLDKHGTPLYGPASLNTIFDGFGGDCEQYNQGDPAIKYDALADRWIISYFAVSGPPDWECVAISQSGDPAGSWRRYAFQFSAFNDYPKLSVWPDAYYLTFNMFFDSGELGWVCAIDRAQMLVGGDATMQCFPTPGYDGLLPADLSGRTRPPDGAPNYVLALDSNALALWRLHVDWQNPDHSTLDGPLSLPVAAFSGGDLVPQPDTGNLLSVLSDRLMYRLSYRRFADHESLVVNHTVSAGGHDGVRWYEIRDPGGSPVVAQQGTFAPDPDWRWMGAANLDSAGNLAIGYSITNDSTRMPGIAVAARLVSDPPGTLMQGEAVMMEGSGVQTSSDRWGDYSSMSVDPSDDCTFWYTTEYLATTGAQASWNTRIASFRFPNCVALPPLHGGIAPTPGHALDAGSAGGWGGAGGSSGAPGNGTLMDGGCACGLAHGQPTGAAFLMLGLFAYNRRAWTSSSSRRRMKTRPTSRHWAWRCWRRTRRPTSKSTTPTI